MVEVALNLSIPSQENIDAAWRWAEVVDDHIQQFCLRNQERFPRYVMRRDGLFEDEVGEFGYEFIDTSESGVSSKDVSMRLTLEKGNLTGWTLTTGVGCVCIYSSGPDQKPEKATDECGDPLGEDEESVDGAAILQFIDQKLRALAKNG